MHFKSFYTTTDRYKGSFMGSYFKRVQLANCKNLKHDRIVIFLFADTYIYLHPTPKIPERETLKFMVVAQNAFENCFHAMGLFQLKLRNLSSNFADHQVPNFEFQNFSNVSFHFFHN